MFSTIWIKNEEKNYLILKRVCFQFGSLITEMDSPDTLCRTLYKELFCTKPELVIACINLIIFFQIVLIVRRKRILPVHENELVQCPVRHFFFAMVEPEFNRRGGTFLWKFTNNCCMFFLKIRRESALKN